MKLLNEILGTRYPIIQGGMANIATGEFAAACSNAGALGIIGAGGMNADTLRENIRRCKQLTTKPFGVNIMLMHPQADEFAKIVVEEGVHVVPLIVTNSHVGLKEGGKLGDLAPTMLQLLGLPIPEEMDGESLLK